MPGQGTKLIMFLITFHSLLYFAGTSGYLPSQTQSVHSTFVDQFYENNTLQNAATGTQDSSIVTDAFGALNYVITFINTLAGILFSPYNLIADSNLPLMFKWIFGGILSLLEVSAIVSYARGAPL